MVGHGYGGGTGVRKQLTVHPHTHATHFTIDPILAAFGASATVLTRINRTGEQPVRRLSQADIAQLVERNLAKVEVASSSLVVRSERSDPGLHGGLAERRGNGLQIRVHGFKSRTHLHHNSTWAIGAAVARFPDTEEVTGSNPVSPTSTCGP